MAAYNFVKVLSAKGINNSSNNDKGPKKELTEGIKEANKMNDNEGKV